MNEAFNFNNCIFAIAQEELTSKLMVEWRSGEGLIVMTSLVHV